MNHNNVAILIEEFKDNWEIAEILFEQLPSFTTNGLEKNCYAIFSGPYLWFYNKVDYSRELRSFDKKAPSGRGKFELPNRSLRNFKQAFNLFGYNLIKSSSELGQENV